MINMHDLDILQELITNEATVSPASTPYGRPVVTLQESGSSTNDRYSVQIMGLPNETVIIKADKFPPAKRFFKGAKGECKRADFIIIAQRNKKNWILHIELKRGKGDKQKIVQQLKGAQCLVAYCRAIGRTFWKEPNFLKEESYEQRFVSIRNISMNIQPTRSKYLPLHDTPEKRLTINAPSNDTLRFNKLISVMC